MTKNDLKRAPLDPKSPIHGMSMEQIHALDNRYKQYPNFPKYYNDLKGHVALERELIQCHRPWLSIIAKWRNLLECTLLVYDGDRQTPPDCIYSREQM